MQEHPDDTLSDIDRKVLEDLLQKTEDLLHFYSKTMGPQYEVQMKELEAYEHVKGDFEKDRGFVKRWSMPRPLYQIFQQMKPDGISFDQNEDFMKWAQIKYPMFHRYKLMAQKWQDVCNGVSQGGGPKPKEERERLARENALIVNEFGQMVKASA